MLLERSGPVSRKASLMKLKRHHPHPVTACAELSDAAVDR